MAQAQMDSQFNIDFYWSYLQKKLVLVVRQNGEREKEKKSFSQHNKKNGGRKKSFSFFLACNQNENEIIWRYVRLQSECNENQLRSTKNDGNYKNYVFLEHLCVYTMRKMIKLSHWNGNRKTFATPKNSSKDSRSWPNCIIMLAIRKFLIEKMKMLVTKFYGEMTTTKICPFSDMHQ